MMKAVSKVVLDKLEGHFVKKWRKPPPSWLLPLLPDYHLQPTENYSWRLYLRIATVPGVFVVFLMILAPIVSFGALWFQYPEFFKAAKYHKLMIGLLSHAGLYQMPFALVFLLIVNYLLYLPRFYFWNRRAARLQMEPSEKQMGPSEKQMGPVTVEAIGPGVWPPAPNRPVV